MNTLNETDSYFAHLFSLPKKHKDEPSNDTSKERSWYNTNGGKSDNIDADAEKFIQRLHKNGSRMKQEEDVDAEAEDFIEHEHLRFQLSKWMSMSIG